MAALAEDLFGVRFLKVVAADLAAGDVRGDGQHGDAAAMAIVEPVDQVQVAGAAASRAHGEVPREMRFGAGGKRGGLFVPHRDPFNAAQRRFGAGANGVGDAVERIAGHAVDALHAGRRQAVDKYFRNSLGHIGYRVSLAR